MNTKNLATSLLTAFAIIAMAPSLTYSAENDLADIKAEVAKRREEAVKRLQDWIKLPSVGRRIAGIRRAWIT
jgi:hypothetical protein